MNETQDADKEIGGSTGRGGKEQESGLVAGKTSVVSSTFPSQTACSKKQVGGGNPSSAALPQGTYLS